VREIVFAPAAGHETLCGPTVLAVAGVAPAPKFQVYEAPAIAVPVKVRVAGVPTPIGEDAVNATTGAAFTVIGWVVIVEVQPPDVTERLVD